MLMNGRRLLLLIAVFSALALSVHVESIFAASKDSVASDAVKAYFKSEVDSDERRSALDTLDKIKRKRLTVGFVAAIKSKKTKTDALALAAEFRIPGLFKFAKKPYTSADSDEARAPLLDLLYIDGGKDAAKYLFGLWKAAKEDAFVAQQERMLKWPVHFEAVNSFQKILKKDADRSEESLAVLQFQLSTELESKELLKEYEQLKSDEEARRARRSYGVGGKAGEFALTDPMDAKIFVPESAMNGRARLIVGFHGMGDSEENFYNGVLADGWRELCKKQGMIFAAVGMTGTSNKYNAKDADKAAKLVRKLKNEYDIAGSRVYSMGFSNGAKWSNYTVLAHSDLFAASISGSLAWYGKYIAPKTGYKVAVLYRGDPADPNFGPGRAYKAHETLKKNGHDTVLEELPGIGHSFAPAIGGKAVERCWKWLDSHENLTAIDD